MRHIFFSICIEHSRSFECNTKNEGPNTFILLNALHTVLNVHIARVCVCVACVYGCVKCIYSYEAIYHYIEKQPHILTLHLKRPHILKTAPRTRQKICSFTIVFL